MLQQVHPAKGLYLLYTTLNPNPVIHLLDNLTSTPQESKRFLRKKSKLRMTKKVRSHKSSRMPKNSTLNNLDILQKYLEQLWQPTC
jgi:hypothetical protein